MPVSLRALTVLYVFESRDIQDYGSVTTPRHDVVGPSQRDQSSNPLVGPRKTYRCCLAGNSPHTAQSPDHLQSLPCLRERRSCSRRDMSRGLYVSFLVLQKSSSTNDRLSELGTIRFKKDSAVSCRLIGPRASDTAPILDCANGRPRGTAATLSPRGLSRRT